MLKAWEISFIRKNILSPITFGEKTFIAPSFFSKLDFSVLNGINSSEIMVFLKDLKNISVYPISKGNKKQYNLALSLQRAGAIKLIDDPYTSTVTTPYTYAVPRELFETVERKLNYSYSQNPLPDYGDSSITDQFFVAAGRVNTFGHYKPPGVQIFPEDYAKKIDKVINDLADRSIADISSLPINMLNPLKTINVVYSENNNLIINPENGQFIELLSDIWNNIFNEPDLQQLDFPSEETANNIEAQQTKFQILRANRHAYG